MFDWWNNRRSLEQTATEIYGATVARARNPAFYEVCGVSDTPEGRFELILLYMFLVLERLRQAEDAQMAVQRRVVEAFVTDMDDNMRELGVGDLTVPKKVKRAIAGLMERMDQYRTTLAATDDSHLQAALEVNFPELAGKPAGLALLARAVRTDAEHLANLTDAAVMQGKISFSDEPLARPS